MLRLLQNVAKKLQREATYVFETGQLEIPSAMIPVWFLYTRRSIPNKWIRSPSCGGEGLRDSVAKDRPMASRVSTTGTSTRSNTPHLSRPSTNRRSMSMALSLFSSSASPGSVGRKLARISVILAGRLCWLSVTGVEPPPFRDNIVSSIEEGTEGRVEPSLDEIRLACS